MNRIPIALILLAVSIGGGADGASLAQRGHALVARMCAQCHAIGKNDSSPHPAAPAFRRLDRQLDFDRFADRLRRGLMTGHQDMPMFRFSRDDANAVAAYLRSIQGP